MKTIMYLISGLILIGAILVLTKNPLSTHTTQTNDIIVEYNGAQIASFNCDGNHDEEQIKKAIILADKKEGSFIRLGAKQFNLDGGYPNNISFINNSNINFVGSGMTTVLYARNSDMSEVIRPENCENITVGNFRIQFDPDVGDYVNGITIAPSKGQKVSKFTYHDIDIEDARSGICLQQEGESADLLFENINVKNSWRLNLWFWSQTPGTARDIIVRNVVADGVRRSEGIAGLGGYIQDGYNMRLENCVFINSPFDGLRIHGYDKNNPIQKISIIDCTFENNGLANNPSYCSGLFLNAFIKDFIVKNCVAYGNYNGYYVGSGANGRFDNTTGYENKKDGLTVMSPDNMSVDILNSNFYKNGGSGIACSGLSNSVISKNSLKENMESAIYLIASQNIISSNNRLTNNTYGYQLNACNNINLIGELIEDTGWDGIHLFNSTENVILMRLQVIGSNQSSNNRDNILLENSQHIVLTKSQLLPGDTEIRPNFNIKIAQCDDVKISDDNIYGKTLSGQNIIDLK